MIALKEFGLKPYPRSVGKLSLWTIQLWMTVLRYLKSSDRAKQEKRGGAGTSEAHAFRCE